MSTLRINVWSGPRNVSTALMYAFAERNDTRVVDEPLYGHYLRVTSAPQPGAAELVAALDINAERVIQNVILGPCDRPVLFLKQMAHHLIDVPWDFLAQTCNVLLIRDPLEMLPSLAHVMPAPTVRDTGMALQAQLFQYLCKTGRCPPVLDAKQLLLNPRHVLCQLCTQLGLGFDEAMLTWRAGPRPEDGIWAKYWYQNIHRSTGFEPYRQKSEPFPAFLLALLAECQPYYQQLAQFAITANEQS